MLFFKCSSPVPAFLHISSCGLHVNKIPKRLYIKVELKAVVKPMWFCLSKFLHLAETKHCFNEADHWRAVNFSGRQYILDKDSGFVKEGNILLGVHICVTSPLKVPMV